MSADTPEELEGLKRAGRVVAEAIAAVRAAAVPGVTTVELDAVAEAVFERHGARSGPILTYGYPGSICLSVDDEIVHGIPGSRMLRAGQLLTIDVAAELDGFHADAATTIAIGEPSAGGGATAGRGPQGARRRDRGGAPRHDAARRGRRDRGERRAGRLPGRARAHGPRDRPRDARATDRVQLARALRGGLERLSEGLVFTIEPMITAGEPRFAAASDGWTIRSLDGARSTHEEHTVVVRRGGALVLTGTAG